jgi:hypothetical protein
VGGNSAAPEPKQSPAALFVRTEPSRKTHFSFKKKKSGVRKIKKIAKCVFLRGSAAWRHGGGAERLVSVRNFG